MADWDNEFLSKKQIYCRLREVSSDYGRHSVDKQSAAFRYSDVLMEMPAAVTSIVHGKWKYKEEWGQLVTNCCSICGQSLTTLYGEGKMNFCPNCGAKMDAK